MGIGEQFELEKTGNIFPERNQPPAAPADHSSVFLVIAQWEFEGSEELVAFKCQSDAEVFAAQCEEYQKSERDDYSPEWQANHPAGPFLKAGAHLSGVDSYTVLEIKVL